MKHMPKISIYKKSILLDKKKQALAMHKAGLTLRQIGAATGRSYTWAWLAIKELQQKDSDKT